MIQDISVLIDSSMEALIALFYVRTQQQSSRISLALSYPPPSHHLIYSFVGVLDDKWEYK